LPIARGNSNPYSLIRLRTWFSISRRMATSRDRATSIARIFWLSSLLTFTSRYQPTRTSSARPRGVPTPIGALSYCGGRGPFGRLFTVGVCAIAVPATKAPAIAPTTKNLVFIVLLQDMHGHESEEPCKRRNGSEADRPCSLPIHYTLDGSNAADISSGG